MDPTPSNGTIIDAMVGVPIDPIAITAVDANREEVTIQQLPLVDGAAVTDSVRTGVVPLSEAGLCLNARPLKDLNTASTASVNLTYTATCDQAPSVYPTAIPLLPLCVIAKDKTRYVGSTDVRTTDSPLQCVMARVRSASNPVFTAPYYFDRMGSRNPNAGKPEPREMRAQVGCTLRIPVTAEERGVGGTLDSRLQVRAFRTTVSTLYEQRTLHTELPEGGTVMTTTPSKTNTGTLVWIPRRGQEGHVVSFLSSLVPFFFVAACVLACM